MASKSGGGDAPGSRERELNEARWQAVLDSAQDAIVSIDPKGRITLFNRGAERIFGYGAAEVLGKNVGMLMPSPDREEHDSYIDRYRRTGAGQAIGRTRNVSARRSNGDVFPIELSVSEARVGDEVAYMAIIRDVTERKRIEEALRDSEAKGRAIVDGAVHGIIVIDEQGIIESVNPAAERMFGYSADELVGQNVKILMPPPFRDQHDAYVATYLRTGHKKIIGVGRELVGQRRDGTIFPMHLGVSEVRLETRRLFTGLVQDISERKRGEERVRELQMLAAQRERLADVGAITAKVVHDLGNPLGGMSMHTQRIARLLKRDPDAPLSTIAEPIDRIGAIVRRLHGLVHDFMNFAREQRLDVKPIVLREFLAEIVREWEPLAAAHGIVLRLDSTDAPQQIKGDAEKLRRVVENLMKNAIEAIGEGPGFVSLHVDVPSDAKVRIGLEDTGPGVPEDVQLFQLFETTKPEGSGFGLAIAKQIMVAHGGDISFTPRHPRGAIFYIELPYDDGTC